jgi:type I restriction enzyme S subunit
MRWPVVQLENIATDLQPGFANQPDQHGLGTPHLRTNNVSEEGRIDLSVVKTVSPSKEQLQRYSLIPGDILFNNTNSQELVGKTAFFEEAGLYLFSNHMTRIRVEDKVADPRFVARYLHWAWKTGGFRSMVTQWVNQAAINRSQLAKLILPLPPLSEQRRIVEILDQADALRRKRAEADAKAARILPALFYQMFGDPATNPMGWQATTLADCGAIIRYGLGQPPKVSPNGVPIIRATNIRRGTITDNDMIFVNRSDVPASRNAFLSPDEVIVVRSGAYTGDVAQVTGQWAGSVAGYDLVVTPGQYFCGEYLEAYLLTPHIQKNYFGNLKARAGQPHLNASQLSATPILRPPKHLQLDFANCVAGNRKLHKQSICAKRQVEQLFSSILHRAFSSDLTARWREAHMEELLAEMEHQARALGATPGKEQLPLRLG